MKLSLLSGAECTYHFTYCLREKCIYSNNEFTLLGTSSFLDINEIKIVQEAEFLQDRQEAEMDMSDSEDTADDGPSQAKRMKEQTDNSEYQRMKEQTDNMAAWMSHQLKEENDNLKCQLEAYKNEVVLYKAEHKDTGEEKDKQIKSLQQALQGMQRQLMEAKHQIREEEDEVKKLQLKISMQAATRALAAQKEKVQDKDLDGEEKDGKKEEAEEDTSKEVVPVVTSSGESLSEREARLIALMSTFLNVHPMGASVDYIWSYLHQVGIRIRTSEIEDLLEKLPSVYKQDILGVGASIEKRWKFIGFDNS